MRETDFYSQIQSCEELRLHTPSLNYLQVQKSKCRGNLLLLDLQELMEHECLHRKALATI